MGFFSWNCRGCDHSVISHHAATHSLNGWMTQAVALTKNGPTLRGTYDGYGSVDGVRVDGDYGNPPCLWHLACWELAGSPGYDKPSKSARDQGFFFDNEHDVLDPRETQGLAPEVIADRVGRIVAKREGGQRGMEFADLDRKADKGLYREMYRLGVLVPAEGMTPEARKAKWGFDPVEMYALYGEGMFD